MSNNDNEYPQEFLEKLKSVTGKRPKTVIDHILKNGYITTEELETKYGYKHPPRAVRDVREEGVPLETFRVKNSNGRSIGAYRFGDLSKIEYNKLGGRNIFSKEFKERLFDQNDGFCYICRGSFELRYLQVDHKVPYEVGGDDNSLDRNIDDYMLLCGSCNRAKSWSCEHCDNWINKKLIEVCTVCYWANPNTYDHIALNNVRRLDIIWEHEEEIKNYNTLKNISNLESVSMPDYVKQVLAKHVMDSKLIQKQTKE